MPQPSRRPVVAIMNETVGIGGAESLIHHMAVELDRRGRGVVCVLPEIDDWLTRQLDHAEIPIHRFRIRRAVDLQCVAELSTALRHAGVTAVHSHEFAMAVYGTAVAHRLGVPHVISLHGNQTMMDRLRRRMALRWAIRNSHATVAVSDSTRRHLEERLGLPRGTVKVIRNGIPSPTGNREATRRALGLAPGTLAIFAAGSLVERKGFHILVKALGRIARQGTPPGARWHLLVAGEGSFRPTLEATIREEGLQDRVTLLGYRLDIPDLQAAADITAMPSLWEGLPLALLEGMHAGNPVVATRTSGIPEAVTDGVEGILVAPGDVEELATALTRLLASPELGSRMGEAARRRALGEFSIGRMTDGYEALYGTLPG